MLVLSRKIGETIRIGSEIDVVVLDVTRGRVKLGFDGPRDVAVRRGELVESLGTFATTRGVEKAPSAVRESPVYAMAGTADNPGIAPLRAFRAAGG